MRRCLGRMLLVLTIVGAGLPVARVTEAAPSPVVNFGFGAQAVLGGTTFGTSAWGTSEIGTTGGPVALSWLATSQGVQFTATLYVTIESLSPVTIRLVDFAWQTRDRAASGRVPIDGVVTGDPNVNHTNLSFTRTVEGVDYLFDGSISIASPAAVPAADPPVFGDGVTDAGHAINPRSVFASGTTVVYAIYDLYNATAALRAKTEWYRNGVLVRAMDGPAGIGGNGWFYERICAGACDLAAPLAAGQWEVRVLLDGQEAARSTFTVQLGGQSAVGLDESTQTRIERLTGQFGWVAARNPPSS